MVMGEYSQEADLLVIGGGPGGYAAAFRAADLGMDVTLVELSERPGGVCLFRGCIPSKTYLHLTELMHDAAQAESMGVTFGQPEVDLDAVRSFKDRVVDQLANGLANLSKRRGVQLIQGRAEFTGSDRVRLHDAEINEIRFKHAILATGSRPIPFPKVPFRKGGRVMSSTGALQMPDIPKSLLIIGAGYVGLELGSVYATFGSKVTVVEMADRILPGIDRDLVEPLRRRLKKSFESILLNTRVQSMQEHDDNVAVVLEGDHVEAPEQRFDRVLVAIGRQPNANGIGLENTGVETDDKGFVQVDEKQRTTDEKILAIGDVIGGMMLAHKATYEGKIAAEVIAGKPAEYDARAVPAVVYTDPQIAYCGLTEEEAERQGRDVDIEKFPWKASGRATTMGVSEGLTKLVIDPDSDRILGMGITGRDAESLISEGVLAVEMGALAEDLALSIHPHPTLSETEMEAAELYAGSPTHIMGKSKKS